MNTIHATIIWKKTPAYKGNNLFFAEVCQKIDGQTVEVISITETTSRILVEVKTVGEVPEVDAAEELLKDKIQAAGLECEHSILISIPETEFCEPSPVYHCGTI